MKLLKSIFEENNALNQYNKIVFAYKSNTVILALLICIFAILCLYDSLSNNTYLYAITGFTFFYIMYNLILYIHIIYIIFFKKFITDLPEVTKFQQKVVNAKNSLIFIILLLLLAFVSYVVSSCGCASITPYDPVLYRILIDNKILFSILVVILFILNLVCFKSGRKNDKTFINFICIITFVTYFFIYIALVSKISLLIFAYPIVSLLAMLFYKAVLNIPTNSSYKLEKIISRICLLLIFLICGYVLIRLTVIIFNNVPIRPESITNRGAKSNAVSKLKTPYFEPLHVKSPAKPKEKKLIILNIKSKR